MWVPLKPLTQGHFRAASGLLFIIWLIQFHLPLFGKIFPIFCPVWNRSVTRLDDFWKFISTNLHTNIVKKIGGLCAILKKINLCQNCCGYYFWKHLGNFFISTSGRTVWKMNCSFAHRQFSDKFEFAKIVEKRERKMFGLKRDTLDGRHSSVDWSAITI